MRFVKKIRNSWPTSLIMEDVGARVAAAKAAEREKWAAFCDKRAADYRANANTLPRHTSSPEIARALCLVRAMEAESLAAAIRKET